MTINIHKLQPVLETYFLDQAKSIPTSHWGSAIDGIGFLGTKIKRIVGESTMAGWALTVTCPGDNNLATYLALQYMLDTATQGRWVMVIVHEDGSEPTEAGMWNYLQCTMGWEVGFVGALVAGNVSDVDELKVKLGKEFSLFGYGTSPIPSTQSIGGEIGVPVEINGVTIRTGDLIVGDSDGVVCVPRDLIEKAAAKCSKSILDEVNILQLVREGRGAVDVMDFRDMLSGNVEIVD